jgi:hypothetical protein
VKGRKIEVGDLEEDIYIQTRNGMAPEISVGTVWGSELFPADMINFKINSPFKSLKGLHLRYLQEYGSLPHLLQLSIERTIEPLAFTPRVKQGEGGYSGTVFIIPLICKA